MNTVHEETLVAQILKFHHRNERAQEKFSIEIDISASSLNRSEEECNATSFVTLEAQKTGFSFNIFNTDAPLADESALSHNLAAHLFTCNLQQLLALPAPYRSLVLRLFEYMLVALSREEGFTYSTKPFFPR